MSTKFQSLLSLFKNRKSFFNNHPDAYRFMKQQLGAKQMPGTMIHISISTPDGMEAGTSLTLDETDMPFMDAVTNLLNEKP